jgi:hypothetical protein
MKRLLAAASGAVAGTGVVACGYVGLVTGRLTLDLGVGRRTRQLGPLTVDVRATRGVVYQMASAPYTTRRPRTFEEKVQILERADGMVLAAHRTPLHGRITAVTVETVTFDPPNGIGFRLVRGPVPEVRETFTFDDVNGGTRIRYDGEMGTDLGRLGLAWGELVARAWVNTVRASLEDIKSASERRTRNH